MNPSGSLQLIGILRCLNSDSRSAFHELSAFAPGRYNMHEMRVGPRYLPWIGFMAPIFGEAMSFDMPHRLTMTTKRASSLHRRQRATLNRGDAVVGLRKW